MGSMRVKKPARKSLNSKAFEMEYELITCLPHPVVIRNLTEDTKKFIKDYSLTEDKYFEIYTKLSKRNTNESKEYLEKLGYEEAEEMLGYFNK